METVFIAEKADEPAGYIKLRTSEKPESLDGLKHMELERIYARKMFQGQGSKILIDKALSFAKESGCEVLWLVCGNKMKKRCSSINVTA